MLRHVLPGNAILDGQPKNKPKDWAQRGEVSKKDIFIDLYHLYLILPFYILFPSSPRFILLLFISTGSISLLP